MSSVIMIGSARMDENESYSGGLSRDQKQVSSTYDVVGEVNMQKIYTHSEGWYILRPKSAQHAYKIAENMVTACNNKNIGYDQWDRLGIVSYGIKTSVKTECDRSSLVRECIREAIGEDLGNFTIWNEADVLESTGLFEKKVSYVSQRTTPLYNGDVLVTKPTGHTSIVVSGNPRSIDVKVKKMAFADSKDVFLSGRYKTTTSLYLRYGPDSDKFDSLVVMPKDTICQCYGYYSVTSGVKWLYLATEINGKDYSGFSNSNYLLKV